MIDSALARFWHLDPGPRRDIVWQLRSRPALLGVLKNNASSPIVDYCPFLYFLQRPKAAKAGQVIVQAAIADAGGRSGVVDVSHMDLNAGFALNHGRTDRSGYASHSGGSLASAGQIRPY